jgi:hypothetical protein
MRLTVYSGNGIVMVDVRKGRIVETQDKESLSYRIPAFGQHVCAVLFNVARWDCQLVPLGHGLPSEEVQASYLSRGLGLVATIGFLDGKFCIAQECRLTDAVIEFMARRYCEHLYSALVVQAPTKLEADASIAWLKSLYQLSDPRKEN